MSLGQNARLAKPYKKNKVKKKKIKIKEVCYKKILGFVHILLKKKINSLSVTGPGRAPFVEIAIHFLPTLLSIS